MYIKMLLKDFKRKKVITSVLFIFMLLAAVLAASGTQMFLSLTGALDHFFTKSNVPHLAQLHSGEYNEKKVEEWVEKSPYVKEWSVSRISKPSHLDLYIENSKEAMELDGAEVYFAKQNATVDKLLNLSNKVFSVTDGHIAVPVYYRQSRNLKIGDTLTAKFGRYEKTFTISDFVRDPQYGSVMMTPKRFIISAADYNGMGKVSESDLYLFSFVLKNDDMLQDFTKAFQESDMPQSDFMMDMSLFKMAYTTADGIVIGLVLACSILLISVTFLTLRFTILSTIEEDFGEIGAMKAIGFKLSGIIKLYLSKYVFLAILSAVIGFVISQPLSNALSANLLLYLGEPENKLLGVSVSVMSVLLILLFVVSFCFLNLRRIGKMTVIDAIRMGSVGETYKESKRFSLMTQRKLGVNVFIGAKDVLMKAKSYILLFVVFLLCAVISILPRNVFNTLKEPSALKFFGFPDADITVNSGEDKSMNELEKWRKYLENDKEVIQWSAYTEEFHMMKNGDNKFQKVRTFIGDQKVFQPSYSQGTSPELENEIALTYLLSQDLNKTVGDSLIMQIHGKEKHMIVTGIFSDMSNGGRAIRACFPSSIEDAHFWQIAINVNGDAENKVQEFEKKFDKTTISTNKAIRDQFMSDIDSQLESISIMLYGMAILVAMLITALFIKMLIAKERSQIAIMKSLGFKKKHIFRQYVTRLGVNFVIAIMCGTAIANILGERVMNIVTSMMGAVGIEFTIQPLEVYIILPGVIILAICTTLFISCNGIGRITISQINAE